MRALFLEIQFDAALRQHRFHRALVRRLHVGLIRIHQLFVHQLTQGFIQGDHAELFVGLNDRRELECLAFADEIRHGGIRDEDLTGWNPPATDFLEEHLGRLLP